MPRILVADDNTNIQKMVALAFQERGIDVVSVGNGEAAVRRMPDLNPDLILADIFMPVRNGYEVCEWVKKDTKFSQTPVILLVGAFDPLDEKEARRVGADGILKKPFIPPDPLIAMVTLVLERNPKIAAELAKAKEKKQEMAAPPEQAAPETIEIPVRTAPKPLPDFPDPSPEEESLIYAFGTGRRIMDNEGAGPGEPPAPKAEEGQETEDEFDSASTTNDWRRTAMQFEVPEEAAMRPAIPSEDYLEATFPSEHAAPKEQAHASNSVEQPEPAQDKPLDEFPAPWPVTHSEEWQPIQGPRAARQDEPEVHDAPAMEEATPEPSFASQATHWMDMMASAPGRSASDWFSSVPPAEPGERSESTQSSGEPASEWPQAPMQAVEQPSHPETVAEPEIPSAAHRPEPARAVDHEESFFADEPEPRATSGVTSDRAGEEHAPEPQSLPLAPDGEVIAEPSGEISFFKDENLVEPPAVRVVPEPLLTDEDSQSAPPAYDSLSESVASPHSFTAPSPEEHIEEAQDTPAEEGQVEFEGARLESSSAESDERVPTLPPPNREALADIPFLNPPSHFSEDTGALNDDADPGAAGSATVDTIVERILAKIEPQLHDLLSQGVKPLIENLLHSELEKHKK